MTTEGTAPAVEAPAVAPTPAGQPAGASTRTAEERAAYAEAEAQRAFAARDEAKAKAKELQAAADELRALKEQGMTETERMTKRIAELEPQAAKAAEAEKALEAVYAAEVADIPEKFKALIPATMPVAERLVWLKTAKAAGAFGAAAPAVPGNARNMDGGGDTITQSAYGSLPLGGPFERARADIQSGKLKLIPG